jgi:hypothetical protein
MNKVGIEQDIVTCRAVGAYARALTRGKTYPVGGRSTVKEQVRIRGDNGRSRWFPTSLFEPGEVSLPCLSAFEIADDLADTGDLPVDVVVTLTTGEKRWCIFATPDALAKCGDILDGTRVRYHYGPHLIVATALTHEFIGKILTEIDSQDELLTCTQAMG